MILDESIFMFCFMKNINFGDMMKLFYKFELERKNFTLVYGPRQRVIVGDTMTLINEL